ncbi:MAG: tRNA pseudouridine(55) synthase TruB [Chloroflexi bacterium]|nr:tRNA pseudouridine(55) synthase TruB [Chloroflexota bacterium]
MARVRRLAGQKRVGHAGTLDPLATGVLPILLGRATRLADFIQAGRKTYVAEIRLGTATETDDAEGSVIEQRPIPSLSQPEIKNILTQFTGEILQIPPKYSALKVAGRRAYALARAGGDVHLEPRPITVDTLHLLRFTDTTLTVEVTCSKGTYIRALARDIAARLDTVGHMSALARTRVGPFTRSEAVTVDDLASRGLPAVLLSPRRALPEAPAFTADAGAARMFMNGQPIGACSGLRADHVWVYDPDGQLIGLAAADGQLLRPRMAL